MATGILSDTYEDLLLDHVLTISAHSPATQHWIALGTAASDSSFTEIAATGGYARKQHDVWTVPANRMTVNTGPITFANPSANWNGGNPITHWAMYPASSGTSGRICQGPLTQGIVVMGGGPPAQFPDGEFKVSIVPGGVSNHLAHGLLSHAIRNSGFSQPSNRFTFLATSVVTDASTGGTITEPPAGQGYFRVDSEGLWNAAAAGVTTNNAPISYSATGNWLPIQYSGVVDSGTIGQGQILFYGPVPGAPTVPSGESADFDTDAYTWRMD